MSADNLTVVRTMYDLINNADEAVLGMFDEQMEFIEPASLPWGGTYHGPEGMAELFAALAEHIEGVHLQIDELRATTSSSRRALRAPPARPADASTCHIWKSSRCWTARRSPDESRSTQPRSWRPSAPRWRRRADSRDERQAGLLRRRSRARESAAAPGRVRKRRRECRSCLEAAVADGMRA